MEDNRQTNAEAQGLPPRRRFGSRLVLVGVFLLGLAIGHAGTVFMLHRHPDGMRNRPEQIPELILRRINERLALTDSQKEQVAAIVNERHQGIRALHEATFARMKTEIEILKNEIAKVLDAKQAETWEKDFERILPLPPPRHPDGPPPPPPGFPPARQ